ncbi:low affinity iron permease family protein [Nocardia blacklockiae]|uniref:low affinity iron permease family protein n=1 Tax=Nocardia blacklockiae TaxID=480036 RepID=UPI001893C8EC|nr:low affinity iron permease family protein [Nocardia blacklockiae]MBF6171585.1 low affinity iron permease family protein [Nocardia blacklockiae]
MSDNNSQRADAVLPSQVGDDRSVFDRFATVVADRVSQAWFFTTCVLIVVLWAPTVVVTDIDTWQLIINTVTTVITFLLVALLQNTQRRSDAAVQQKLNALADGLADLMQAAEADNAKLRDDRRELLAAVGLEHREGAE